MCTALWQSPSHGPVKCGQCIECRLAYSREWAIRICHEQQMHDTSCMLTLTYDQEHLPLHGQLYKEDLQRFFKRLRKNFSKFRYVAAGEYGDLSRRPHFHIALFGVDFLFDRVRYGTSKSGDFSYRSDTVSQSWKLGSHDIGSLNFESAAYIARYILKKIKGPNASALPLFSDPETGELVMPNPEFFIMSKGIGKSWFRDFFMSDVYPHASVITPQGSKAPVPRYYKSLLKEVGEDLALSMSWRTTVRAEESEERTRFENLPVRKAARAAVSLSRSKLSNRSI